MYRKRDTTSQYRFRLAQISPIQEGIVDIFSRLSVRLSRSLPTGKLLFPDRSLQKQTVLMFSFFCFFCCLFLCFMFLSLLLLRTPRRHKPSSDSHSIYVPQAQQNNLQSALHRTAKYIQQQQYVRVDQSVTTQGSRHEQVLSRATMYVRVFYVSFFPLCCSLNKATKCCNLDFFQVPLTLSPVTDRRLDVVYYFSDCHFQSGISWGLCKRSVLSQLQLKNRR